MRITNLRRLVDTVSVREKLGLHFKDKRVYLRASWPTVARTLTHIIEDIAEDKINVKDIYTLADREHYIKSLPSGLIVKPSMKVGDAVPLSSAPPAGKAKASRTSSRGRVPLLRRALIGTDCRLNVTNTRIRYIEAELRKLDLEVYPNAVSVLYRVFLELSCDDYIDREGINVPADARLAAKLNKIADALVSRRQLTQQQARPVRMAAQKNSLLSPSVTVLNDYVHNRNVSPSATDLRASWDSLQSFFMAIWAQ